MLVAGPSTRRDHASPVFPDGPTETGHTMGPLPARARPEVGRGGPTCPAALFALSAPYGLRASITLTIHRESVICSFACLSPPLRCVCTGVRLLFPRFPPILTVSLITGATRAARVTLVHASLSRDRVARGTHQDRIRIATVYLILG